MEEGRREAWGKAEEEKELGGLRAREEERRDLEGRREALKRKQCERSSVTPASR